MTKIIMILLCILLIACEHLEKIEVKGEITGTKYSNQQFGKNKHIISARYRLNKNINIKGGVSQQYKLNSLIEPELPDYGETSIEIIF